MWSKQFWKEATERAIKTAAQTLLAFIGLDGSGLLSLNWTVTGVAVGGATLASVVTSIVSASTPVGVIGPSPGPVKAVAAVSAPATPDEFKAVVDPASLHE